MFDQFLKQPHALAAHHNGPLAEERRRYLAHRAEHQMSRHTLRAIVSYTLLIAKALRLPERRGELITRAEIEAAANRWFSRRSKGSRVRKNRCLGVRVFTGHAVRWLSFLGRMQVPAAVRQPYADQVSEFTDYMVRERGLSPSTVTYSRGTMLTGCWRRRRAMAPLTSAIGPCCCCWQYTAFVWARSRRCGWTISTGSAKC